MYTQKELPGFRVSPTALWPTPSLTDHSFEGDKILELFLGGVLGPEHDGGLTSLYTRDKIYNLFYRFCKAELSFVETSGGLLPANAYDANLLEYMKTFIVPKYGKRDFTSPVEVIEYPGEFSEDTVVMNGAFNGVPHPGWVEALTLVRKEYPGKKLVMGLGTNFEIENAKAQVPVGNTKWRASLLAATGLVDKIFCTKDTIFHFGNSYGYPNESTVVKAKDRSEGPYDYWWSNIYGKSSDRFPFAVVVNGKAELERKSRFMSPTKTEIFDLSQQNRIFSDFHSQNVHRWNGYSVEYVMASWEKLREKYL